MAGTSRKRQETSESPRSRAKNSKTREAGAGRQTASRTADKKTGKTAGGTGGNRASRADTPSRGTSRRKQAAKPEQQENSFILTEVAIIAVFAVSVLLFLSNFGLCGVAGDFCRQAMLGMFGKLGYLFPVFLCVGSCFYASNRGNRRAAVKLLASLLTFIALCGLAQMIFGGGYGEEMKLFDYFKQDAVSGKGGGLTGGALVVLLSSTVGTVGAYVILLVLFVIGIVCITEKSLVGAVKKGSGRAYRYARDDMDRRRESYEEKREERREERRRMREEKARGIDMDAMTLTGYPSEYDDGDGENGFYEPARDEDGRREAGRAGYGGYEEDYVLEPQAEEAIRPEDTFSGSITMPGREEAPSYEERSDASFDGEAMDGEPETDGEGSWSRSLSKDDGAGELGEAGYADDDEGADSRTKAGYGRREKDVYGRPLVSRRQGSPHAEALRKNAEEAFYEDGGWLENGQNQEGDKTESVRTGEAASGRGFGADTAVADGGLWERGSGDGEEPDELPGRGLRGRNDVVLPYPGLRGKDTPAREEQLLKSIYAERDTRTFAEMNIGDDEFYRPEAEKEVYYEPIDAGGDGGFEEDGPAARESGAFASQEEADGGPDREDLAGRSALRAVKDSLKGGEDGRTEDGYYKPVEDKKGRTEDGAFFIPEEAKTVVTASGKVIETDTEEVRKTIEKKRAAASRVPDSELSVREQMDRRRQQEAPGHSGQGQNHRSGEEAPKRPAAPPKPYAFPPLDLLKRGKPAGSRSEQEYRDTAIKLQQTLKNFGVGVTVTNISCGPAVTRYELHPEQGVKVSKIVSLSDDIKLNLAAADIRIEAPIPGKAAVGIEVPNKETETVVLRDLLETETFKRASSKLSFAVGKDIAGQTVVTDIAKMPHLLIAGATGSGKSVCINTLIMSIIYKADPEDVKLIMIDPKVVELSVYNGIPHLLIPVVTDPKKASGALNWAVAEMSERYQKFAKYNVRDLKGYNEKIRSIEDIEDEDKPKKLPQIIIIVDELADLMMVAPGEVEDAICRLAQLARAAGIHLVIATQRPSVNVITGLIKANIPSRIAFSVSSGVDSRTIIDMNGAEKLLGKGDMLFYPQGIQKPQRVQGAFVSDQEVSRVVEFLASQGMEAGYDPEVEKKMNSPLAGAGPDGGNDRDAYFEQAARFIIEKDKASIGMLQRMLKIGFNRAARIMDQLAEAGIVGEDEGTKPRKVLMSMEELEEFLEQGY